MAQTKRVKCIRGFDPVQYNGIDRAPITGRVYTVLSETAHTYDIGTLYDTWSKNRFIIVGCPCDISECVAHKKA